MMKSRQGNPQAMFYACRTSYEEGLTEKDKKPASSNMTSSEKLKVMDIKDPALLRLSLASLVLYQVSKETTAKGLIEALCNMYENPSSSNKICFLDKLFDAKVAKNGCVSKSLNEMTFVMSQLESLGISSCFDDVVVEVLLGKSWGSLVTGTNHSSAKDNLGYDNLGSTFPSVKTGKKVKWLLDSGASRHSTSRKDILHNYVQGDFGTVRVADGRKFNIIGKGEIQLNLANGKTLQLTNVQHVAEVKFDIISVRMLAATGCEITFGDDFWKVTKGSTVIALGKSERGLYYTSSEDKTIPPACCAVAF